MLKSLLAICLGFAFPAAAQLNVSDKPQNGFFSLVSKDQPTWIYVDTAEQALVKRSAELLQRDIEMVTGTRLSIIHKLDKPYKNIICIGTPERSALIKELVQKKKLSTANISGRWEAYQLQHVANPFNKVENILVIAGSDRRGVAFGVFELSKQIGVSPWYWWADVPVKKKAGIYLKNNTLLIDSPKVKYRGIFINDEAPALSGWSKEKFGGFNHLFYEKVFELILRLKGNYLWPAMWGNAFYDDDAQNIKTADDYGVVIGTSHHEPLMRAHDEWRRYGSGKWNYDSNELKLKEFWRGGMQRATNEKIVSIGMRGDGDEPMTRETATALLERIVKDQRQIIEEVTGKPASETPQLWALYKEVQDYYDKGMRVPDDVTLLLCDDNWGNIRKLPKLNEPARKGGYGIYYHFDYVGGPRNYKWINTNNIARVWEQIHLAWEYNARQIWIVNVGDIKPMEFPISFFLDYAWNPKLWNEDNLRSYYTNWAAAQFGNEHSKEIGDVIRLYAQYSARRKPELLDHNTYDLFTEWSRVANKYDELYLKAKELNQILPEEYHDSYYELVLHLVEAFSNLNTMYHNIAWNRYHAKQKWLSANEWAEAAKEMYVRDSLITLKYHQLNNGKWKHMMSQTHIGYTNWQQPPFNSLIGLKYVSKDSAVEEQPETDTAAMTAEHLIPKNAKGNIFYEVANYVSIEAEHWTKAFNSPTVKWKIIPDIGRTGSGITTFPVTASTSLTKISPHTEYDFYCIDTGNVKLSLYFSPTLNFHNDEGLQLAVSIDNEPPQVINLNIDDKNGRSWNTWVANNIIIKTSDHRILKTGKHTIKYWMISPAVILQKLVLDFGSNYKTYLGPFETLRK